ncbi:MAG: carbon monoxide dehydrogenase, partial [Candidatus Methanomethylicota archaeon]
VVEPNMKAIDTAERIRKLAYDIEVRNVVAVGNKISSKEEEEFVRMNLDLINLELLGIIPYDNKVKLSDMNRSSVLDLYPNSIAIKAIEEIKNKLINYIQN